MSESKKDFSLPIFQTFVLVVSILAGLCIMNLWNLFKESSWPDLGEFLAFGLFTITTSTLLYMPFLIIALISLLFFSIIQIKIPLGARKLWHLKYCLAGGTIGLLFLLYLSFLNSSIESEYQFATVLIGSIYGFLLGKIWYRVSNV